MIVCILPNPTIAMEDLNEGCHVAHGDKDVWHMD